MELNASCFAAVTIWEKKWRTACYFSLLCGTAAKCQFCSMVITVVVCHPINSATNISVKNVLNTIFKTTQ